LGKRGRLKGVIFKQTHKRKKEKTMSTSDAIRNRVLQDIESRGQSVIGVQGPEGPSFAYTIGLSTKTGYELLCVGLNPKYSTMIFNDIAETLKKGEALNFNTPDDRFANLPCMFVEADARAHEYTVQADNFFNKEVRVVQMVMSDKAGLLPGQPGYDHGHMDKFQPLLFDLEAHVISNKPSKQKPR
jgi:Domain of unknown function (DUF4262)